MKKSTAPTTPSLRTFLETLEPRIAPAGLANINYIDVTLGTPQLLKAGQGLKANGEYLIAVTQGEALIFTTDINGTNQFAPNDITGIAAGNGLKLTSFVNINGDIVTDLEPNGTLSDSSGNANGHNGLLLLDSTIDSITLRSVTAADITPADIALAQKTNPGATAASIYTNFLAPSTYSINGNIYAGGGIGDGAPGDGIVIDTAGTSLQATQFAGDQLYYSVAGINPFIGTIKTGTAAGGSTFSFGYYTSGVLDGQQYVGTPGTIPTLAPFTPGIGEAGGSINGLLVGNGASTGSNTPGAFTINAIDAGNGGIGAAGGSISNIQLDGDSGGLQILSGNGGAGPTGGNGGSITNLSDLGSVEGVVQIQTGNGGEGYIGSGGTAGALSLGQFLMNGDVHINLGNGGNALGNAGAGNTFSNATLTPTQSGGIATAVSIITSYRTAGDVGTPSLIDFNDDGYSDAVFVTNSPDQIGIAFGGPDGINAESPVLYLSAPGIDTQTNNSPDVAVGDFTGQYYPDGTPILDIAVANSTPNNTNGIEIFLNPATQSGIGDGYQGVIGSGGGWSQLAQVPDSLADIGQNFITPTLTVPLPVLTSVDDGQYLYSGAAVTNLVVGDFNGATYSTPHSNAPATNPILDLAYTTQVFAAAGAVPYTEAVMLQGTGNGEFYANFNYSTTLGAPTNMPVLDGGIGGAGHGAFQLQATAAIAGDPNSDMLVLTGVDDAGYGDIKLIQYLNPVQQEALGASDTTTIVSGTTASFTNSLMTVDSTTPFYDTLEFNNPGGAYSNTVKNTPATPIALAVTTIPGPGEGSDLTGSIFQVIVLDSGNAISTVAGAYTPVPGSAAGLASVSTDANATQGVSLTGQIQTLLGAGPPTYTFSSIVAGDLMEIATTPGTPPDIQFALYTSASAGSGNPTGLEVFTLTPNGLLHAASSYTGAGLNTDGAINAVSPEYGYDANIVAFGLYNNISHTTTTNEVTGATTTTLTNTLTSQVGYIAAKPTNNADAPTNLGTGSDDTLIEGFGDGLGSTGTGPFGSITGGTGTITLNAVAVNLGLNNYNLDISSGNGGNSRLGSGGAGGNMGSVNATKTDTVFITLPADYPDQPTVNLYPGLGGSGLISGGAGGAIQYLNLSYPANTSVLGNASSMIGGSGGAGLFGSGGAGGAVSNLQAQNVEYVTGGNGGSGYRGGAGGIINGTAGVNGYSTQSDFIYLLGGTGGNGIVSGGSGGTITGFATEFLEPVSGYQGYLSYIAGSGGSAVAGSGGSGGSILNCSPLSSDNNLTGPIILDGGLGGNGLTGGAGGAITNFSNQSTNGTQVTVVSIQAGNGGAGTVGNGGTGGAVTSIYASGQGVDPNYGYEFNSILGGDGGNSYGATGGLGGSVTSVTSVAQSSAEALAAGAGGDGLVKGGNGGAILNDSASSAVNETSKLIVIAGAGGNAYGALSTAPGVADTGDTSSAIVNLRAFGNTNGIAGNGGSITNFKQQVGTQTAIDMIAGNGGSLENYGSPTATKTNVGTGGSITNTSLLGNAGDTSASAAIQNYNNGDITGFVQNTLAFVPYTQGNSSGTSTTGTPTIVQQTQLTDAVGNVGVVVGAAGSIKGGLPSGDASTKTGSVINFTAYSVMSMVAGSVDNIAAINTISGLTVYGTGNSSAGSYKDTPVTHSSATAVYYAADGTVVSSPEIGGALMDGAVVVLNNPGNLVGQRIWKLA